MGRARKKKLHLEEKVNELIKKELEKKQKLRKLLAQNLLTPNALYNINKSFNNDLTKDDVKKLFEITKYDVKKLFEIPKHQEPSWEVKFSNFLKLLGSLFMKVERSIYINSEQEFKIDNPKICETNMTK